MRPSNAMGWPGHLTLFSQRLSRCGCCLHQRPVSETIRKSCCFHANLLPYKVRLLLLSGPRFWSGFGPTEQATQGYRWPNLATAVQERIKSLLQEDTSMANNSTIRRAVRLALASGAATTAMVGVAAVAQEAQDASTEVGTIVVTGTRIQRADYEATSPVVTVDSKSLQESGTVQLDVFLNQLPQLVPALSTTSNNPSANGGAGQALIDLRGLGVSRTLVLLDGT